MPHQRDDKVWLHLRDAICLNRTDIIAEALASQQINVDPDKLRKALYDVKELGIDACSVVDERTFRGSIKELIFLAAGENFFVELPGRENKWDNVYSRMLSRATDQVPEFPSAYERSWSRRYYPGLPDYQHEANDAWFQQMLVLLKPDGTLMVPNLGIGFNKQGEQIYPPLDDSETPSQFIMKHSAADDGDDVHLRMMKIRAIMDENPLEMEELERRYGQVWSEAAFNRDFESIGMSTPITMAAMLKTTGQHGTLWYQNNPRYYWNWQPVSFEPSHYTEEEPQGVFESMRDEARDSQNLMMDAITSLEQKINLLDELVRTLSLETRPDVIEKLEPIVEELEEIVEEAATEGMASQPDVEPELGLEIDPPFQEIISLAPDVSVILTNEQLANIEARAADLAGQVATRSGAIPVIRHFLQNEARGRVNTIIGIAGELGMGRSSVRHILVRVGLWKAPPQDPDRAPSPPALLPPAEDQTANEQLALELSQIPTLARISRAYEVILFYLENRGGDMTQRQMAAALNIAPTHFQRILTRSGARQADSSPEPREPVEPQEEQSVEDIFGGLQRPERVNAFSKWRFR